MASRARLKLLLVASTLCAIGCKRSRIEEPDPTPKGGAAATSSAKSNEHEHGHDGDEEDEDDEDEAKEEAKKGEMMKPQFWRVKVVISGNGLVTSLDRTIECGDDGTHHGDSCGPTGWTQPLAGFKPAPSVLTAFASPGWRLSRWAGEVHRADGRVTKRRQTSVKDFYVNYFKKPYDLADYEVVTAVFTPAPAGMGSGAPSASATQGGGAGSVAPRPSSSTSVAPKK